ELRLADLESALRMQRRFFRDLSGFPLAVLPEYLERQLLSPETSAQQADTLQPHCAAWSNRSRTRQRRHLDHHRRAGLFFARGRNRKAHRAVNRLDFELALDCYGKGLVEVVDQQQIRPDLNNIAVSQRGVCDKLSVKRGAVGLGKIEQPELAVDLLHTGVSSRNRAVIEHHIVADQPANCQAVAFAHDVVYRGVAVSSSDDESVFARHILT